MPFVPLRKALLGLILAALCAACNYPTAGNPIPTRTSVALPATAQPTPLPAVLPASLYFLSARSGSVQVWQLEADAATLRQLTNEAERIDAFDVAASDGQLAFLMNNQIYLAAADGSGRRLFLDNAAADRMADEFAYTQAVSAPLFSPNGLSLAYGYGGVWSFDLQSLTATKLLENQLPSEDEAGEIFTPIAWSPDGAQLLISIATPEGNSLGAWQLDSGELVRFDTGGLACCQAVWAPDSRSVLVASATLGLTEAGLWRYDSRSGAATTLIETVSGDTYNFVGWPLQLPNSDLQYFYASAAELPEGDLPLFLVHSAADGRSGRAQLRSDAFSLREALWAADGSLAVVGQLAAGVGGSGPIVLAYADERPLQVLVDTGYFLRWGP
jgi:hypothetical protein